jgi:pyruvate-formate lyase-activating enzyme
MYEESGSAVKERFPRMWSIGGASRIESVPFYHIYPGSKCFVIGSAGCNFKCLYCSNAFAAKEDPQNVAETLTALTPSQLVSTALKLGCANIIFNINEPTVSLPSLLELSHEAKRAGLPLGCLTNGYSTEESTEMLADAFSFFNIGLKGLSERFNRECIGIPSVNPVLRNIQRLAEISHVELITPVIQGMNEGELNEMADFISSVDREIPWHVFRLLPESDMKTENYPDINFINNILESARKKLPYLYFHNFVGSDWVNTLCPGCGEIVVERFSLGCGGDQLRKILCEDGTCPSCGRDIRLIQNTQISGARL